MSTLPAAPTPSTSDDRRQRKLATGRECNRRWRERQDPDERRRQNRGYMRRYYQKSAEARRKQAARSKRWARENPEKVRQYAIASGHRRRAKMLETPVGDRESYRLFVRLVRAAERVSCYWCGRRLPKGKRVIDHIVPIARGGADDVFNLCCSCRGCNCSKHCKLPHEFNGQFLLAFAPSVYRKPKDRIACQRPQFPAGSLISPAELSGLRLTPLQTVIFRERFVNKKSLREVAQVLGIKRDSVKKAVTLLRRKVRREGATAPPPLHS